MPEILSEAPGRQVVLVRSKADRTVQQIGLRVFDGLAVLDGDVSAVNLAIAAHVMAGYSDCQTSRRVSIPGEKISAAAVRKRLRDTIKPAFGAHSRSGLAQAGVRASNPLLHIVQPIGQEYLDGFTAAELRAAGARAEAGTKRLAASSLNLSAATIKNQLASMKSRLPEADHAAETVLLSTLVTMGNYGCAAEQVEERRQATEAWLAALALSQSDMLTVPFSMQTWMRNQ